MDLKKTVNLLDTPGHQDFSEDTYRVLTAVDSGLMVIDAAKGVEAQTIELLDVCRLRNTPIVTFMNKCDREVRDSLDLLDEVDPIPQSYFLEVSSPGIERLLQREKDFVKYQGRLVNIQLYAPWEGHKKLQGGLGTVTDDILNLVLDDDRTLEIPRGKIAWVRLAWVD